MGTDVEAETLSAVIRARRSVRRFKGQAVPRTILDEVLEAARWAPSASNRQGYRLLVVSSTTTIVEMADVVRARAGELAAAARRDLKPDYERYLANFTHFEAAPVVIAPIFRRGLDLVAKAVGDRDQEHDRVTIDAVSSVAAAVMNLLLAAHAHGLGSCWMTGPLVAAQKLCGVLNVPDGWDLAALVPLGYADETPEPPKRRDLRTLVRYIE